MTIKEVLSKIHNTERVTVCDANGYIFADFNTVYRLKNSNYDFIKNDSEVLMLEIGKIKDDLIIIIDA